jgi:hypothetical protein
MYSDRCTPKYLENIYYEIHLRLNIQDKKTIYIFFELIILDITRGPIPYLGFIRNNTKMLCAVSCIILVLIYIVAILERVA